MVGGDAAMIVALADSLFFSIDPSAARGRVLLFLVVSFAPFVVIAPLIGPVIDRAAGGRRTVIQLVAAARVVISLLMATAIDNLALFPLVFAALVLQKTYLVSKQALVPSVVRDERDLVEANSKLGLIAGLAGFVAVIPAAVMQLISNEGVATLIYAALLFGFALASATRLPADVIAAEPEGSAERVQLQATGLQLAEVAMLLLRATVGFTFFLLAFWLRDQTAGTAWFGVAVALAALGTMTGNAIGPRLRRSLREETMLLGALGSVERGRGRRRARGRRAGGCAARRCGQPRCRRRPAGLRKYRPAGGASGQPGPRVRPLRDPVPARLGGRRADPGDHRHPRPARIPARRPGQRSRVLQLRRRDPLDRPTALAAAATLVR